jgi:hypothetical protein
MALSTYSDLQTAVALWLHRSDLTSVIPDLIALAEVRIFNGGSFTDPVRITEMQNRDSGTIANQSITLPSGYLETLRLAVTSGGQNYALEYISPTEFSAYENQSGNPQYYTIVNNAIKTAPNGGLDYIHDYYKRFDALATTSTNDLLTNAPNVYLYGTLLEAAPYLGNDPRIATWQQLFAEAVAGVNKSERKRFQSNAMRVMPA